MPPLELASGRRNARWRGGLDAPCAPGEIGRHALGPPLVGEVVHLQVPVFRLDFGEFSRLQRIHVADEVAVLGFLTEHQSSSLCLRT